MKKLLLITLSIIAFINIKAQTVYVATDGSGDYNCNGTNDEIEINQALSYINSQGGGTVSLKSGTYSIDNQIKIYDNTIFEGVDSLSTIIKIKDWSSIPQETPFIINSNFDNNDDTIVNNNITLRNFSFDGNRINNEEEDDHWPGDSWHTAVAFKGVSNININAVNVYNSLNDAFQLEYCNTVNVTNCSTSYIGHDAIYFIYSNYLIAENNTFDLAANAGVRTDNSNHILINNNYIFDKDGYGGDAIEIAYRGQDDIMDDLIIENNIIEQAPMSGITLYSDDPSITNGSIIRNNVIYQVGSTTSLNESAGINITNFDNVIIQNNTIYNCVGSGIRFGSEWYYSNSSTPRSATITNNIITGNTVYGSDNVYGIEILDITSINNDYNNIWDNKSGNYHNCTQGANDISVDPLYVNAPYNDDSGNNPYFNNVDLSLQSTSPCIDQGTTIGSITNDINGVSRPQGVNYDMGAYEYQVTTGLTENDISKIIVYPNPTSTKVFVNKYFNECKYEIISITGTIVKTGTIKANNIDLSELNTGIYFIKTFEIQSSRINIAKIIKE